MSKKQIPPQFQSFGLSPAIISTIKKAGYIHPTDIQVQTIPPIIQGRDILAGAETGSGKTAAFVLPLIDQLLHQKRLEGHSVAGGNHIRALILVPTRELAIQIREVITQFSEDLTPAIKTLSVYGGVKINPQMIALRGGTDILVATPGRLLDLAAQNAVKFNKLKTLILDEVDRLVSEGFKDEIEAIFQLLPKQRQNMMFTATFPNCIRYLIRRLLVQPVIINLEHSDDILINQRVFTVNYDQKNALIAHLLNEHDWKQILIFCSAKKTCDNLVRKLANRDIKATAMHGNKEQRARTKALQAFKAGNIRILIATDVAARGIDIQQLPCVINFDLPRSPKDYTHRIGRTGRAGEIGLAISLIAHHEYNHFEVIEKTNNIKLKRENVKGFEASKIAPPLPKRTQPKKKSPKKMSKKQKQRLEEKQNKKNHTWSPQKPMTDNAFAQKRNNTQAKQHNQERKEIDGNAPWKKQPKCSTDKKTIWRKPPKYKTNTDQSSSKKNNNSWDNNNSKKESSYPASPKRTPWGQHKTTEKEATISPWNNDKKTIIKHI